MKVSILTYHWEDNYGATLQAYATYKVIQELGYVPEFIDLRLPYNPSLVSRIVFGLKRFRFNKFRKRFFKNLSIKTYRSVEALKDDPPLSDYYLVGSDQTWNPEISKKLFPAFFLTFGNEKIKRISYATSIGLNHWQESPYISNAEIKEALNRFSSILLREDSAIRIIKRRFNINSYQVLDPVLLFKCYPELTGKINLSTEVVIYKLINDKQFYDLAKKVASSMNLPIRSIGSIRKIHGYHSSYPETVQNWLKRIASASLIMTDSFHGTVLALLYHRQFIVYVGNPNRITRIESLLTQLGLEDRIFTKESNIEDIKVKSLESIDWEKIDSILDKLRKHSLMLLKESLSQ